MRRAATLVAALVVALRILPISDPDYHWHLATGRYVFQSRSVPRVDPFSHTAAGQPWIFVDWLSDLGMYALHALGGDTLVVIVFALLGASAILIARSLPIALLLGTVVAFRTTPRPQTATFGLLAALIVALERGRVARRWYLVPPFIIAIWQNVHSSAPLGVAVVFAYAVGEIVDRRSKDAALSALGSFAALFVSVRPIDRLLAGFDHLGDPRVAQLFPEWGHAFQRGVFGAWVLAALLLLALSMSSIRRGASTGSLLAVAGMYLVGLFSVRLLPLAAIVAATPAALGLERLSKLRWPALAVSVALMLPRVQKPGLGLAKGAFPERAAAFARVHDLRGKLFNEFHYGGYLIWELGQPVFIDGRSMAVYGIELTYAASAAVDDALDRMIDGSGATIAIVPPDRRMGSIQRKPGWSLVAFDDSGAVLVKESAHPNVAPFAYRVLTPGRWFELSTLSRDPAAAVAEAERARAEAPDSSLALVTELAARVATADRPRADALLAEAERRFPGSQRVARARLVRCLGFGDVECACATARAIEREHPNNSYTEATIRALKCP